MKKSLENKIQVNIILIYCIVALICSGMLFSVYKLSSSIDAQKEKIEANNVILTLTHKLISSVEQAQASANLYASTQNSHYISHFQGTYFDMEQIIDSLLLLSGDRLRKEKLIEISRLLNTSKLIIHNLNQEFVKINPFDTLYQTILDHHPQQENDSLLFITIRRDSILTPAPKQSFWHRLANLFVPQKNTDSLLTIRSLKSDTLKIHQADTSDLLSDIQTVSEHASKTYTTQITKIKKQVNNLILSDRQISDEISALLLGLHSETIHSIMQEIQTSEQILKTNYRLLLIAGIVSMILTLIFILLIINDLKKGRLARKALEEANELTERLMEERHKLLLSVSHDIKTPLTSILGYVDLWQQDAQQMNALQGLSSVQNSGKYMLTLLENLLEFSKLEQGTSEILQSDFKVEDLCNEIADLVLPLVRKKNLNFLYTFSPKETLWIRSDRLKIKQIVINILSNAIKYTQQGDIVFEADYVKNRLRIVVSDTGVGIPEKELDELFKPFSRIEKNNSLAKGSGFGLYVVKRLVDLLQGVIIVQSKEGKGTHIKISIPAKEIKDADSPAEVVQTEEKQHLSNKKCRLLAIDDDSSLLSMLQAMTKHLGHEIVVCYSLAEFESQLPEIANYDIILTDMEMGSYSGVDILQKTRAVNAAVSVIVMTGRNDFDLAKATKLGFNGYLPKPFFLKSLRKMLEGKVQEDGGSSLSNDFQSLNEMFGGDEETIKEILRVFIRSTHENIALLQQYMQEDNFGATQALCHTMLPMYAQLNATECVEMLKKMDSMRGKNARKYPHWKEDMEAFIRLSHSLVEYIDEKYFRQTENKQ
ncbi:MAG: response regulator [Bacteroidales bacterium]|jgi:signal transduction histidine kinase/CheY-like chemotaxis protein|nr:response regulator [Bacteroidales bacterium]